VVELLSDVDVGDLEVEPVEFGVFVVFSGLSACVLDLLDFDGLDLDALKSVEFDEDDLALINMAKLSSKVGIAVSMKSKEEFVVVDEEVNEDAEVVLDGL
jgi:hypothetical protein